MIVTFSYWRKESPLMLVQMKRKPRRDQVLKVHLVIKTKKIVQWIRYQWQLGVELTGMVATTNLTLQRSHLKAKALIKTGQIDSGIILTDLYTTIRAYVC